jgi:hypothetical protein
VKHAIALASILLPLSARAQKVAVPEASPDRAAAIVRRVVTGPHVAGEPVFSPTGTAGLRNPEYDRVDGLSLGAGAQFQFREHAVELEPTVTYRSRLGAFDPALEVRLNPSGKLRFEGRGARDTRTNDGWIYGDLLSSALTFLAGIDTRNYFRSNLVEGRVILREERSSYTLDPFVGGRYERVSPITAVGNVWSLTGRNSAVKMLRPNPLVEAGDIASALVGASYESQAGVVHSRLSVAAEPSFRVPAGTSQFIQLTLDGAVDFPTFGSQGLHVRAHGVATHGSAVPIARYSYLGGMGTLRSLDLMEQGGTALLFVENRYTIPIAVIQLPMGISPVLTLRDAFGAAGVGALPGLQHEIGIGIGLPALWFEVTRGVAGRKITKGGVGISVSL